MSPTESSFEGQDEEDEEVSYSFYTDKRHLTWNNNNDENLLNNLYYCKYSNSSFIKNQKMLNFTTDWRIREKIKTVSVSLVLCLNIGVDPPDLIKTKPCAKMECWIDPFLLPGQKALEAIGRNLQAQYEAWQPRARYRLSLDPSIEETKKLCCSLRRNAKDERILFHYNGHGVPKPTVGGEIWVFNKSYTQYIPVSIYDIQTWLGSPCIYVYDCSNAGHILNAFNKFASQRDAEFLNTANKSSDQNSVPYTPLGQSIQLAACQANEVLPMSPDLPADLFTACLTTPIMMALRWFVISNPLIKNVTLDMTMKVPGRVTDRRTPLGELNWIFTSITDTIAWSVLPTDLFLRLFRNDLMVAALFRNFLLADRIMRSFNCHPMSSPILPPTHQHPLWEAWDLAADHCLSQLPQLLENNTKVENKLSSFFNDQLSAFEIWIKKGGSATEPPLELPIVLQVLLSQVHRLRALLLLSKFLDFGQWAVNLALSVGIFPYVLKLLQSPALELRPVLVFIWAKLLAVDPTCRNDLLKDNGYTYFIGILTNTNTSAFLVPNISEHRAMCVFILSVFCRDFPAGQQACLANDLLPALLPYLSDQDSLLRQWTCICMANFWSSFPDAKWAAINVNAHGQLTACLVDPVPEVRTGAIAALGQLLGDLDRIEQVVTVEKSVIISILKCLSDPSPIVRRELACVLSKIVEDEETKFIYIAHEILEEDRKSGQETKKHTLSAGSSGTVNESKKGSNQSSLQIFCWKSLLTLSVDPFPPVASVACVVIDKIYQKLLNSPLVDLGFTQWMEMRKAATYPSNVQFENVVVARKVVKKPSVSVSSGIFGMSLDSSPHQSFKKSSSFSFSLRNLVGINNAVNGSGSPLPLQSEQSPRMNRVSNSIRRRPQSLMLAASAEFSPNRLKVSPSEPLLAPNSVPAKPKASEPNITVQSPFYDWSCGYFMEPQMKIPEVDDPGSIKYNERQWRQHRNRKISIDVLATYVGAASRTFNHFKSTLILENDPQSTNRCLLFHSYDPFLLVSDRSEISIIDYEAESTSHLISNLNPVQSHISCMKFINEEDASILMTGSTDGVIRLYRNYHLPQVSLVSAWRVDSDSRPSISGNLICEWHQLSGVLYTAGVSPVIKIWDADEELCVQSMTAKHLVSSMSLDHSGNMLLVGSENGSISLFDRRIGTEKSETGYFSTPLTTSKVLSAKFSDSDSTEFMSCFKNGDILLWDVRQCSHPVLKIETVPGPKSFFQMHDQAPIMACASQQDISIMNLKGKLLGDIKNNGVATSFLNSRSGQFGLGINGSSFQSTLNGIIFHPKKLLLASSTSTTVSFFDSQ